MREWGRELKVTVVVVVLATAAVIALWPRDGLRRPDGVNAPSAQPWAASPRGSVLESDAVLEALRRRAGPRPCPQAAGASAAGGLTGVVVPCLADSKPVELAAVVADGPVLLNLWASWCGPCRAEMPALAEYSSSPGAVPVVGVNVQDRASDALELMTEVGVRYPSVVDVRGRVQEVLGVPPVLPLTYLVRPDGSAQRITDPLTFRSADEVAEAVNRYLPEAPGR